MGEHEMTTEYDCTEDVKAHKAKVEYWMRSFWMLIEARSQTHDSSKLADPIEKALFDHWTPELRKRTFGTEEYKQALDAMGEGIKRHYKANRHHPEHYPNGVNGMTLVDVIEMLADWMAAAERNNTTVDLENAKRRFDLSPQLVEILANTLREEDAWNAINGVPVGQLCPEYWRRGRVEGFGDK